MLPPGSSESHLVAIDQPLEPTKANEDRTDALIAAYVAAWHRRETTRGLLREAWERRGVAARWLRRVLPQVLEAPRHVAKQPQKHVHRSRLHVPARLPA